MQHELPLVYRRYRVVQLREQGEDTFLVGVVGEHGGDEQAAVDHRDSLNETAFHPTYYKVIAYTVPFEYTAAYEKHTDRGAALDTNGLLEDAGASTKAQRGGCA